LGQHATLTGHPDSAVSEKQRQNKSDHNQFAKSFKKRLRFEATINNTLNEQCVAPDESLLCEGGPAAEESPCQRESGLFVKREKKNKQSAAT